MPSPRRTRLKNATQHPGLVVGPAKCRTTAEVKAATEAKQAANVAKKQAKIASIHRAAEFESTTMAKEELLDATPRPKFNSKSSSLAASAKMVASSNLNIQMSDSTLTENDDEPEDSTEDDKPEDSAEDGITEDDFEKTPIPISKKRKAVPSEAVLKAITKSASEVHPQPLRRTYAVADLTIEARSHGGGESGDETDRQINQNMQMMIDQDISPEYLDIYVSDDSATAKLRRSFAAGGPATEQPRYGWDKGHNDTKNKIRQRRKVTNHGSPAELTGPEPPDAMNDATTKTRSDSGPPLKKMKTKTKEEVEVEGMKMKKRKESVRDAIEAVQVSTKDNVSRKHPSHVANAPTLKGKGSGKPKVAGSNQIIDGSDKQWRPENATRWGLLFPS